MSYAAFAWALEQPVGGTGKLVLLVLAHRHGPAGGCFPSQARLAADSGLSRAAVNRHLALLERRG